MKTELRIMTFNPWVELAAYQPYAPDAVGATSVFVGSMRTRANDSDGKDTEVRKLFLEHYESMTEAQMKEVTQKAMDEHHLTDALVLHRIGDVLPGEAIVLIATWSLHRAQACRASKDILEAMKSSVPFWKKEYHAAVDGDGDSGDGQWVNANTPG